MENFETQTTVDMIIRGRQVLLEALIERGLIIHRYDLAGENTIAYVELANMPEVMELLGGSPVGVFPTVNSLLDYRSLEAAGIVQLQRQPYIELTGRGTLLGFVDTGIDYTNPAFQYEDLTTKILNIWDQTIEGAPPANFHFGTEYTADDINAALRADDPFSVVPHRDDVGHGTFLASVAGGREQGDLIGAAPDADIIMVKLRKCRPFYIEEFLIVPTENELFSSSDIMLGIDYILRQARALRRPVAICLGLGSNLGGHDGFQHLEEYLSALSRRTGVCICIGGGNESQARHHAEGVLEADESSDDLEIRVPENAHSFLVQVWNRGTDRLSVSLRSPTGESTGRIPARSGTQVDFSFVFECTTGSISYYYPVGDSGAQLTYIKIRDPTPGIWTLTVYADLVLDGAYHVWLPITGQLTPGIEFLQPSPNTTVVIPGTTIGVITTGAYDAFTNSLFPQSSWGPTRLPIPKPDFCAPGVAVRGMYPGGEGTMNGTSVSAAITAGAGALLLQWGLVDGNDVSLNTYRIRALMISGCIHSLDINYPNPQWGYGTLNLFNTFSILRST